MNECIIPQENYYEKCIGKTYRIKLFHFHKNRDWMEKSVHAIFEGFHRHGWHHYIFKVYIPHLDSEVFIGMAYPWGVELF